MRSTMLTISLALLLSIGLRSTVDAAAIYLKDSEAPVVGFIKSRSATHITIVIRSGDESQERLIPRDRIVDILETVDPARLARLDPAKASEYRDYAEELMVKQLDPEAAETAIRLFLIAAYHGDDDLQRTAFRSLIRLARSKDERQRLVALAWRQGAMAVIDHGGNTNKTERPNLLTAEQRETLNQLIRSSRAGVSRRTRTLANRDEVKMMFVENDLGMTHRQFLDLLSPTMTADRIAGLVELELRIMAIETSMRTADGPTRKWADLATDENIRPVNSFSIENVTEFDPKACYFVDGRWASER